MKIAIIGAGAAGLCAIRHAVEKGHMCDCFEQTDKVGGTWNYSDLIGIDRNGLPVHSSMYKGLRYLRLISFCERCVLAKFFVLQL